MYLFKKSLPGYAQGVTVAAPGEAMGGGGAGRGKQLGCCALHTWFGFPSHN